MDIDLFHETIGDTLTNIWGIKNNSSNKLSLTCLYSINIFSNDDLIFIWYWYIFNDQYCWS